MRISLHSIDGTAVPSSPESDPPPADDRRWDAAARPWVQVEAQAAQRNFLDILRSTDAVNDEPTRLMEDSPALAKRLAALHDGGPDPERPPMTEQHASFMKAWTRHLGISLVLAACASVDWRTRLAMGIGESSGPYHDDKTGTLHNATGLPMQEAVAAADALIARALEDHPDRKTLLQWPRQLRLGLIGDPTLALHPPSGTVRYGSVEWGLLRVGMETAMAWGIDPFGLSEQELAALGRVATTVADIPRTADTGQDGDPNSTGFAVLRYMAAADGKLRDVPLDDPVAVGDAVRAYAMQAFRYELQLHDALQAVAGISMPTRRDVAADLLRRQGINPDYRIRANPALVPTGLHVGPVTIDTPILPIAGWKTIAEEYFERDALSSPHANQLFGPACADCGHPGEIAAMPTANAVDRWLSTLARETNTNLDSATVSIRQAGVQVQLRRAFDTRTTGMAWPDRPPHARLPGYFATVVVDDRMHSAYFAPGADMAERLPPNVAIEDWAVAREGPRLRKAAAARLRPARRDTYRYVPYSREIAAGIRAELPSGALAITLETTRLRAQLPHSLSAEFDKHFDAYRDAMAGPVAAAVDAWLSMLARRLGVDISDAEIVVERADIDVHRPSAPAAMMLGAAPYGPAVFGTHRLPGYFVTIRAPSYSATYHLPFGTGEPTQLPPDTSVRDWITARRHEIFDPVALRRLRAREPGSILHTVTVRTVGSGKRAAVPDWLPAACAPTSTATATKRAT